MRKLYIDMDGVLADFDRHYQEMFGGKIPKRSTFDKNGHDVDWTAIENSKDFYLHIPPMPDMETLWGYVSYYNPTIITGIPYSVPEAADNKRAWVKRYLGEHVPVICCGSKDKCLHARPGDTLVDDWEKYKLLWISAGGIWITHRSAVESIEQLIQNGWGSYDF